MSDAPSAYPLAWPMGKPRTPSNRRKVGTFSKNGGRLTNASGADRVEAEVGRLGGRYLLISSNVEVTLSGRPRSGQRAPEDPGVCIYFQLDAKPYAMACDRYTTVADNLGAIAAHIEATRAITRHGVASAAETLQAFQALPSPEVRRHWTAVLGLTRDEATRATVAAAYRRLAAERHPDCEGGSHDLMADLNAARDEALAAVTA